MRLRKTKTQKLIEAVDAAVVRDLGGFPNVKRGWLSKQRDYLRVVSVEVSTHQVVIKLEQESSLNARQIIQEAVNRGTKT